MVVKVRGAVQDRSETIVGVRFALGGIRQGPVSFGLSFKCRNDHSDGVVELAKHVRLQGVARFGEFQIAVADVAGTGDLRADVIAEVTGKMEDEMADTVGVGKGVSPELLIRQGIDPLVEAGGVLVELIYESTANSLAEVAHQRVSLRAGAGFSFL